MAQRRNCPEHAKRGRKTPESLAVTYFNAPAASFTGLLTVHSRAEFSVTLMSLSALRNFELINHLIKLFIDGPRADVPTDLPVLFFFSYETNRILFLLFSRRETRYHRPNERSTDREHLRNPTIKK